MDLTFLSQADALTLRWELAKAAFETAKSQLEEAKQAYDEHLARAEENGIPRAKLKKLTEDRVAALLESGVLGAMGESAKGFSDGKRERDRERARKSKKMEPLPDAENGSEGPHFPQRAEAASPSTEMAL